MTQFHKRAIGFGGCYFCFCLCLLGALALAKRLLGPAVEHAGEPEGDVSFWTLGKWLLIVLQAPAAIIGGWWRGTSGASEGTWLTTAAVAVVWSVAAGYMLACWVRRTELSHAPRQFEP